MAGAPFEINFFVDPFITLLQLSGDMSRNMRKEIKMKEKSVKIYAENVEYVWNQLHPLGASIGIKRRKKKQKKNHKQNGNSLDLHAF